MRLGMGLVAAFLLLCGAASAQIDPQRRATALQVIQGLPGEIAGLMRDQEVIDYESRQGGAGLGASVTYRMPQGRTGLATVYYYAGYNPPRPVLSSDDLQRQFTSARRDIEQVGQQRRYRVLGGAQSGSIMGADGRPAIPCYRMALAFEQGGRSETFTCIGAMGSHFVKLRMTLPVAQGPENVTDAALVQTPQREKEVLRFGAAMLAAVLAAAR